MLEIKSLSVSYGMHRALADVSVRVKSGEVVVILGANGAGKSSLLRAVAGICDGNVTGSIEFSGEEILGLSSDAIVRRGIAFVPEGRGIFGELSVAENLMLGAFSPRARTRREENLERVLQLFPKLAERRRQVVRTMSGGEQQMVAIGRALMSDPEILMLDEPSLGLSPLLCKELFQAITHVRHSGTGVLLVEQNAKQSLAVADRGYLIQNGSIKGENTAAGLLGDPSVQAAYLGGGARSASSAAAGVARTAASNGVATSRGDSMADTKRFIRPGGLASAGSSRSTDALAGESLAAIVARAAADRSRPSRQPVAVRPSHFSPPAALSPSAKLEANGPSAVTSHPLPQPPSSAGGSINVPGRSPEVARLIAELEAAAAAARSAGARGNADRRGTGDSARPGREESLVYRSWRQSGGAHSDALSSKKSKE